MAKILLVEDNIDNRELFARRLEFAGYEVISAGDGMQALELAKTEHPNLILMDLRLPVLDGWQATKQLKANQQTQNIPVIALTAHALAEDRIRGLESGCDEYETKPVDFAQLLTKIQLLIARAQQH